MWTDDVLCGVALVKDKKVVGGRIQLIVSRFCSCGRATAEVCKLLLPFFPWVLGWCAAGPKVQ